ncbi:30S ribosomal protein S8 [Candidatus Saccharibacteria bacterium]|nr:30S ribosomal protein S8 [Candidatus Saccharibacteria bacterium]
MTDPVADMLSRLRNAIAVNKTEISLPYSRFKAELASVLSETGWLNSTNVTGTGIKRELQIEINQSDQPPRISHIKRLSTSGRRLYVSAKEIPAVKNGRGMVVISTSKGLMSGVQARSQSLGGELICEVY